MVVVVTVVSVTAVAVKMLNETEKRIRGKRNREVEKS
jgi:hypothetical protein